MSETNQESAVNNSPVNVRFAVVGTQRSGTTLIQSTLNSHPQILCEGELFHMRRLFRKIPINSYGRPSYHWWLGSHAERWLKHALIRRITVHQYLEWYQSQCDSPIIGFKLMWSHTKRFPGALDFLRENNYLLLHIRRRNTVRCLISRIAANARGLHHSKKAVTTPLITVPTKKLLKRLNRIAAENSNWERLGTEMPYLRIDYEDYVQNPADENERMLGFLGASTDAVIKSDLVKVTPNDLHKVIANYDEVAEMLKGTEYEYMLEHE